MTPEVDKEHIDKIKPVMQFFLFCSAANQNILKKCPSSERQKYAGVGATIFFTGLLAALSGGFALYTIFNDMTVAVLLGICWGALIFNLDRFIVSTVKKNERMSSQWKQVAPRLVLAIFLSIVISKPLEMKIFEQEINEKLHYTGVNKLEQVGNLYEEKMANVRLSIESLRNREQERFDLREKYYEDYKCECEGSCGTGQKGIGSECLRKQKKYEAANEEYQLLKAETAKEIADLQEEIETLKTEKTTYKEDLKASFASGLMAKMGALSELPPGPSWAIVLLLICIEVAPILTKLLSPYGPYDHMLKTMEYEYEIDEIATINLRNQKLNNQLTLLSRIEEKKVEQQVNQSDKAVMLVEEAYEELVKEHLSVWLEKEKKEIRSMKENFYPENG
ncbi:MAG: DUF4407 domain-containing protein [Bacteroidota bacterium]